MLIVLVIILIVAAIVGYIITLPPEDGKNDDGKNDGKNDGNSEVSNVLPGWTLTHYHHAKDSAATIEECMQKASDNGFVAAMFRNSNHASETYKNTCAYYTLADPAFTGDEADDVQTSACADPAKIWPDCGGGFVRGWVNNNFIHREDAKPSLERCQEAGVALGHPAVMWRTPEHLPGNDGRVYANTCAYYSAADPAFTGDINDRERISACSEPAKSWPNC